MWGGVKIKGRFDVIERAVQRYRVAVKLGANRILKAFFVDYYMKWKFGPSPIEKWRNGHMLFDISPQIHKKISLDLSISYGMCSIR